MRRRPPPAPPLRLLPAAPHHQLRHVVTLPCDVPAGGAPEYACGRCGAVLLRGAPLKRFAGDEWCARATGVRCPHCRAVSLLQVTTSGSARRRAVVPAR